jgi:hypothetical protein
MRTQTGFRYQKKPHAIFSGFVDKKPLAQENTTAISLTNHLALAAIRKGKGVEDDLHNLAFSVNMALILAELGYGGEFATEIREGQLAMVRTIARFKSIRKVGFSGGDMLAIQQILGLVDEQIMLATKAHITQAMAELKRRLNARDFIELPEEN